MRVHSNNIRNVLVKHQIKEVRKTVGAYFCSCNKLCMGYSGWVDHIIAELGLKADSMKDEMYL